MAFLLCNSSAEIARVRLSSTKTSLKLVAPRNGVAMQGAAAMDLHQTTYLFIDDTLDIFWNLFSKFNKVVIALPIKFEIKVFKDIFT